MCKNGLVLLYNEEFINVQTKERLVLNLASELKHDRMLSVRPDLWIEWNFEKNNELGFDIWKMTKSSKKKVWWICNCCGSNFYTSSDKRANRNSSCPYCAGKKVNHTNSLASLNPDLAKQWHPSKNGELTPHDVTCGSSKKVWWLGGCGHEWEAIVYSRKGNVGCPYCANYKTLKGFNDINTTNPELTPMLVDINDGYCNTAGSLKKVKWKCLDCGIVVEERCYDVLHKRWSCKECSDGVSYPHKVMRNVLRYLNIDFEEEIEFEWSDKKRYDFHIPSLNLIIETHGGQHYKKTTRGRTLEEERENDRYKREIALNNNIKYYIELDCRESELKWIKESICNSTLFDMFDLSLVDWSDVAKKSEKSLTVECWRLYNDGNSSKYIMRELHISRVTYYKYIKRGRYLGVIKDSENSRTILELNSDMDIIQEFENTSRYYKDINKKGQILRVLKGQRSHYKGLHYMYKEDYEKYIREQQLGVENSTPFIMQ